MLLRTLYLLLFLSTSVWAESEACRSDHYDGRATVKYVYDGDSLRLDDKRKVRFVGINTPEMDHEGGQHQPYAEAARARVEQLLQGSAFLYYRYDREHQDRYGRQLLHLFLANGDNLSAILLRQGLAWRVAISPNLAFQTCYQEAEAEARKARRGVWRQPVSAASEIAKEGGFHLIRATVLAIKESRHAYWLRISPQLSLQLRKSDQAVFAIPLDDLPGREIEVRGWLRYHNKGRYAGQASMRLTHPSMIEIVKRDK